jgi:hypothetical protein
MSLSPREIEQITTAVVSRLAQERHDRFVRWMKWSIPVLSLLIAVMAAARTFGLI